MTAVLTAQMRKQHETGGYFFIERVQSVRLDDLRSRATDTACVRCDLGLESMSLSADPGVGWSAAPDDPPPDPALVGSILDRTVRIGFERTFEQDVAFGIRQLVDVACKALSPAINDPYSAIQTVDHLAVILYVHASRPVGDHMARHGDIVPSSPAGGSPNILPPRVV